MRKIQNNNNSMMKVSLINLYLRLLQIKEKSTNYFKKNILYSMEHKTNKLIILMLLLIIITVIMKM